MICLSINDGWKDIHAKQIYVDLPDLKCFILNLLVVLQMNDNTFVIMNFKCTRSDVLKKYST